LPCGGLVTARRPCPPALGPLEQYEARYEDLFCSLAQRQGFREYLIRLLARASGTRRSPVWPGRSLWPTHAVQRLQFSLTEPRVAAEQVNDWWLELLREPMTASYHDGVVVIDDFTVMRQLTRLSAVTW
jgi:hypothetical protein